MYVLNPVVFFMEQQNREIEDMLLLISDLFLVWTSRLLGPK